MRWKSTFAAVLAVVLLIASSSAAACETACTLRSTQTDCHRSHGSNTAQISDGHCPHMTIPAESGTAQFSILEATSNCHHMLCRQPDSLIVSPKGIQLGEVHWMFVQRIAAAELDSATSGFISETSPPLIVPLFSPLSIALRI